MTAPAELLIVRHGHTAANPGAGPARPTMSGWKDTPLTAEGHRQAALLCGRLSPAGPFAAVYSSPLRRALDTARCLAAAADGILRTDPDLREISCGEVEGWDVEDVRARFPELWARNAAEDDDDFRWPGGESYRELRARAVAAADRIARAHPGERVVVVTHTGVVTQLLGVLAGAPPARWSVHRPGNASITRVEWADGGGRVLRFDAREHLAADPSR
ncbi:MAG TPA: histidine phosphatase family protein [Anaeromyxobacteraceae bacterium]|nr:histidine phosphatase family protein [Anaeromyxobacteraceae bacterium]